MAETQETPKVKHSSSEKELPEKNEETEKKAKEEREITGKKKRTELEDRLMKLRMKMNQSKVLNRKEVLAEGSRMLGDPSQKKEERRLFQLEKKRRDQNWLQSHSKAAAQLNLSKDDKNQSSIKTKHMVQMASKNIAQQNVKMAKAKVNALMSSSNDLFNSEQQHMNYQRNIKSLPNYETKDQHAHETFDLLSSVEHDVAGANATNSVGARRLADEMKRRIDMANRKRKQKQSLEFESTDINYINKRNKGFNEKIARNYDKHTAEIRQNLERGTAL